MQAIHRELTQIINGTKQFIIPVFQRDYHWGEVHCEQLWKDVVRVGSDPSDRRHFLGSVVYISTGDSTAAFTRWLLIDGQQRVTTLMLLLTALRDHIRETGWQGGPDDPTPNRIEAYYLKNTQEEGERRYKLFLRRHDQESLRALLDGESRSASASETVRDNYEYMREQLAVTDPSVVYRGIGRLVVVDVTLHRGIDDPQLIFESLNSTGMDLSQSDLIRNFILMRLPEREQTRLYESYWQKVESLFRGSEGLFDSFMRDYLALLTESPKQEKADQIYFAFRRHFTVLVSETDDLGDFLARVLRFARYYAAFFLGNGNTDGEPLIQSLARLRRLVDVAAILVMRLFDVYEQHRTLSMAEFVEAIELLESYVFRRSICGEQTRGYWQIFANLAYQVRPNTPFESLKATIALLRENYRFPEDAQFREALELGDMYHKRVCFYLLERLENHGSKELTDTTNYSIEHILPQNERLVSDWREMLGTNWKEIQQQWLHRLGNLTLTAYNSTYSDRPFEQKKTVSGGFNESAVRLNRSVRDQVVWTEIQMEERGRQLASRAVSIWPALHVDRHIVDAERAEQLRNTAKRSELSSIPMTSESKGLFAELRSRVLGINENVIEKAERMSVTYHCPSFFLEVLPRKRKLVLLLDLEFSELGPVSCDARDATQWKFFVHSVYSGGVFVAIRDSHDIEAALPLILMAHAHATSKSQYIV